MRMMRTTGLTAVTILGLALVGCGQQEAAAPAAEPAPAIAAAPDTGRGVMLSQRADAIEAEVLAAVAAARMTPAEGQAAQAELLAVRQTLSGMLAQAPGPLPQETRILVAQALDAIEADLPQ